MNALSVDPDCKSDFAPGTYRFFFDQESFGIEYGYEVVITDTGTVVLGKSFHRDPTAAGRIPAFRETTAQDPNTTDVISVGGLRLYVLPEATKDARPAYIGIDKHEGHEVGLYDTVLGADDYQQSFVNGINQAAV